ncbi:MAG: hypothetical protein V3S55_05655, partial [Nitrospiraceae bacterium]
ERFPLVRGGGNNRQLHRHVLSVRPTHTCNLPWLSLVETVICGPFAWNGNILFDRVVSGEDLIPGKSACPRHGGQTVVPAFRC